MIIYVHSRMEQTNIKLVTLRLKKISKCYIMPCHAKHKICLASTMICFISLPVVIQTRSFELLKGSLQCIFFWCWSITQNGYISSISTLTFQTVFNKIFPAITYIFLKFVFLLHDWMQSWPIRVQASPLSACLIISVFVSETVVLAWLTAPQLKMSVH
jgi:hypothetical protein